MLATDVMTLYHAFTAARAPVWLMGGWGVDALLGRQTRPHHDLDVLVDVSNLERLRQCLIDLGFALSYTWDDEVKWVRDESWASPLEQPTAFVYRHPDGREVDVHVVRECLDGSIETLWNVPYALTATGMSATGVIDGHDVRCLSRLMQEQAHTGYELPAHHLQDLRLLDEHL